MILLKFAKFANKFSAIFQDGAACVPLLFCRASDQFFSGGEEDEK